MALTFALQMATLVPALQRVFKTQPLTMNELLVCLAASSVVFFGVELEKWLARRGWLYRERETPGIRATTGTMDQGGGRA